MRRAGAAAVRCQTQPASIASIATPSDDVEAEKAPGLRRQQRMNVRALRWYRFSAKTRLSSSSRLPPMLPSATPSGTTRRGRGLSRITGISTRRHGR